MKLKCDFILREIAGETMLIPVGQTALQYNGLICLNPVGAEIWKGLQQEKTEEEILADILDQFDVTEAVAQADMEEFLNQLREKNFIE